MRERAGQWFDPSLVRAFEHVARDPSFWTALDAPDLDRQVLALEPGRFQVPLDDDYLDDIAAAFGQVVDSKSPFTSGHSQTAWRTMWTALPRRSACRWHGAAGSSVAPCCTTSASSA